MKLPPGVSMREELIEKYLNDPKYHRLVDIIEGLLKDKTFTLVELHEACNLANNIYQISRLAWIPPKKQT